MTMPSKIQPGDTFLLPKSPNATEHLWIVLTGPHGTPPQAVMVNITTQRLHSDTTVVLDRGDHPFVRHPSVVNYADARMVAADALRNAVDSGSFRSHARCSEELLEKIRAGLLRSPYTPTRIKEHFRTVST